MATRTETIHLPQCVRQALYIAQLLRDQEYLVWDEPLEYLEPVEFRIENMDGPNDTLIAKVEIVYDQTPSLCFVFTKPKPKRDDHGFTKPYDWQPTEVTFGEATDKLILTYSAQELIELDAQSRIDDDDDDSDLPLQPKNPRHIIEGFSIILFPVQHYTFL